MKSVNSLSFLFILLVGLSHSTNSGGETTKITAEECLEKLNYVINEVDPKDPNYSITFVKALIVHNDSPCITDKQVYLNTFHAISTNAQLDNDENDENDENDKDDFSFNLALQCFAVVELLYERSHSLLQLVNKGRKFKNEEFEIKEIKDFVDQFRNMCSQYIVKEDEVSEDQLGDL